MQRRDLRDLKGRGPWAVASSVALLRALGLLNHVDPYAARLTCLDLRAVNSLDDEI